MRTPILRESPNPMLFGLIKSQELAKPAAELSNRIDEQFSVQYSTADQLVCVLCGGDPLIGKRRHGTAWARKIEQGGGLDLHDCDCVVVKDCRNIFAWEFVGCVGDE